MQDNFENSRSRYEAWHALRAQDEKSSEATLRTPWNVFAQDYLQAARIQGKKILEIACGRGQLSAVLAQRGASVIAGDFSSKALEILKKERSGPAIHPLNADAETLPLKEASVDVIVSCETIEHVPTPQKALAEFRRVLKKDGFLLLTCPSYLNLYGLYRIYLKLRNRPYNSGMITQPIENWLFSFQVRGWLLKNRFEIIFQSGLGHYFLWPGRIPRTLVPLEESFWLNRLLKPFALHSFFIARPCA